MILYNYGGLIAGALPGWDVTAHPYGYMAENVVMSGVHALYISDGPFIYDTANGVIVPTEGAEVLRAGWYNDAWSDFVSVESTELLVAKWCNVDIYTDAGGMFLKASEPERHIVPITIIHDVIVDFMYKRMPQTIHVMQGDQCSRNIRFTLLCGGVPWEVPSGTEVMVRFRRPSGASSNYSTMPDGGVATMIAGNTVTVKLAPQVMTKAGDVLLCIRMDSGETRVHTFYVRIAVEEDPGGMDSGIILDGTLTLQSKTVYQNGEVTADEGYDALESVTVQVMPPLQEKTATENGYVTPDEGYYGLSRVKVAASGGGAALNIAYGDTAPEDTSKLWVKTAVPAAVQVRARLNGANEAVTLGISALPVAAYCIAGAAVGEKVYLFGARIEGVGDGQYASTIRVFNTKTGELETLSTALPKAAFYMTAAAVGTKIYLFGGNGTSYLDSILVMDTQTNTITTLSAKLPKAIGYAAAVAVGTKIYVFGGYGSGSNVDTIHVFDTNTNTITTLSAKLPTAASEIAAAAVGTKVYLFGGDGTETFVQLFDTETNQISTLDTTLPVGAYAIGAAAVGTSVYLFGGYTGNAQLTTILRFDAETQSISELSATLPTGAHGIAAAAVGASVYLFGGAASGNKPLNTINEFVASLPLEENNILIEVSLTENLMELLPGMEIGVGNVYRGNASGGADKVAAAVYKDGSWLEI